MKIYSLFISSLTLHDFRSYSQRTFEFGSSTTFIIGPNAIGKTNILEAIALLAIGGSFRISKDEEMIAWDQEFGRVSGVVDDSSLEVVLTHGLVQGKRVTKKRFLVNGVGKRNADFIGKLRVVLFQPQDLLLVTESPGRRRDYLDFVLSQTDREYYRCLNTYRRGLRQRNKLLDFIRDNRAQISQLEFWNRTLVKNGEFLQNRRAEYLDFLNQFFLSQNVDLSPILSYDRSVISEKRLEQYLSAEIATGNTLVGPHRDDFKIKFQITNYKLQTKEDRELAIYGSRGQQRLTVLLLKLGELDYIEAKTEERPILLLDDIFSELDQKHDQMVLDILGKQQTIITNTELEFVNEKEKDGIGVIKLG